MENPYATESMSDMPVSKSTFLASVLIALVPICVVVTNYATATAIPRELWDIFRTLFFLLHHYHFSSFAPLSRMVLQVETVGKPMVGDALLVIPVSFVISISPYFSINPYEGLLSRIGSLDRTVGCFGHG